MNSHPLIGRFPPPALLLSYLPGGDSDARLIFTTPVLPKHPIILVGSTSFRQAKPGDYLLFYSAGGAAAASPPSTLRGCAFIMAASGGYR